MPPTRRGAAAGHGDVRGVGHHRMVARLAPVSGPGARAAAAPRRRAAGCDAHVVAAPAGVQHPAAARGGRVGGEESSGRGRRADGALGQPACRLHVRRDRPSRRYRHITARARGAAPARDRRAGWPGRDAGHAAGDRQLARGRPVTHAIAGQHDRRMAAARLYRDVPVLLARGGRPRRRAGQPASRRPQCVRTCVGRGGPGGLPAGHARHAPRARLHDAGRAAAQPVPVRRVEGAGQVAVEGLDGAGGRPWCRVPCSERPSSGMPPPPRCNGIRWLPPFATPWRPVDRHW